MKSLTSILTFVLFAIAANSQRNIDVLHYKFEIELNDNNDSIYGKATIISPGAQ